MSGKSPTTLEVTSGHDHSCLLGRKTSNQTNKQMNPSETFGDCITEKELIKVYNCLKYLRIIFTSSSLIKIHLDGIPGLNFCASSGHRLDQ